MNTLKVWFTDFWPEWKDENFILPILSRHYDVVFDKENPDVVFHSIFGNTSPNWKCKKILFIAENIRNNYNATIQQYIQLAYNEATATISFDLHSDINYRLPLWQVYILLNPSIKDQLYNRKHYDSFERWCGFTVSNPSNFMRNSAFHALNQYKHVHSYGKMFTNDLSLLNASKDRYWRDAKQEFFQNHSHKFMLAYENTPCKYYCTEKLMDAFLAGSVPIYWGDTRVAEDWNENAFINATKIEMFDVLKEIDTDDKKFQAMYNEPIFTEEQKEKLDANLAGFEPWLLNKIS